MKMKKIIFIAFIAFNIISLEISAQISNDTLKPCTEKKLEGIEKLLEDTKENIANKIKIIEAEKDTNFCKIHAYKEMLSEIENLIMNDSEKKDLLCKDIINFCKNKPEQEKETWIKIFFYGCNNSIAISIYHSDCKEYFSEIK